MYIVWGSRLMGKCDVLPGLFHVGTKFGHLYYLPLIPTQTYVVLAQNGKSFRGVPISLSFKSILFAWMRAATFIAGFAFGIGALVVANDRHPGNWVPLAIAGAITWILCGVLCYAKFATQASFVRACQLAKAVGLNEAGYEIIAKAYGQAAPRGFAVEPATPGAVKPAQAIRNQPATAKSQTMQRPAPAPSRAIPVDDGSAIPLEPAPTTRKSRDAGQIGLT